MFWSRKPRPPLTTRQRVDLELLLRRSIEVIGGQQVRTCQWVTDLSQLSLDQSSPDRLLQSAWSALQERMPAAPAMPRIDTASLDDLGYPALYRPAETEEPARIVIAEEVLSDPLRTLIELAYQYASHYWSQIESNRPVDSDPRNTHLLPICCGLGIVASDASLYDQQWTQGGYSGWSVSRSGYYTAAEIGYALALLSRCRKEENGRGWLDRLRLDSRVTAKQALRYFDERQREGRPLLFDASSIPASNCDNKQLAQWLGGDNPDFAMAAAHALCKKSDLSTFALQAALAASESKDRDLKIVATRVLGRATSVMPEVQQRLTELVKDSDLPIALAAIESADSLGISLESHEAAVTKLLDQLGEHSIGLLAIIGRQGPRLAGMEAKICAMLARSIQRSDEELTTALLDCLGKTNDNPRNAIVRRIRSKVIRDAALERIVDSR